jgi:Secretion system C-terminal sorting domain
MKKIIFILSFLPTQLTFGQINNGGFEIWDTVFTGTYSSDLNSLFGVVNPYGGVAPSWVAGSNFGTSQTTESHSGNYSLILHNWYNYVNEWVTYHDSLTFRPQYVEGFYKYITDSANGISHGTADVSLTRFNGATTDTIAKGTFQFNAAASFIPFQISLNYLSLLNPDSITIYVTNANTACAQNAICNLLYLDDIAVSNTPAAIDHSALTNNGISIYPNPFANATTIQSEEGFRNATLTMFNQQGQSVKELFPLSGREFTLNCNPLPAGLYFLQIVQDNRIVATKKIVLTDY